MRNQLLQFPKPQSTLRFPSTHCISCRPPILLLLSTQIQHKRTISQSIFSGRLPPVSTVSTLSASSRLHNLNRQFIGESMATANGKAGTTTRLTHIRDLMKENKIDIYVVPSEDAHQSEYVCAADKRREFISGFTGSAGTAVITTDKAALFTDGRYFNQASKQLDENWQLMKVGLLKVPTWQEWVADISQEGKVVGVDPAVITVDAVRELKKKLKNAGKGKLVAVEENLVDKVWGSSRPPRPENPVFVLPDKFTGKPYQEKLVDLRKELTEKKTSGMVVSMLDEVAWLFNLRGSDIDYNPVFFAYALVTHDSATLYIDEKKLTKEVKDHLKDVKTAPYGDIFGHIKVLGEGIDADKISGKIFVSNKCSWALTLSLGENKVTEGRSPVQDAKAVKNDVEQEGMRQCHIRDGTALVKYFAWLEQELLSGRRIDEVEAADQLEKFRSETDLFVGLSFDTISATGPNGAVIHYKPEKETCRVIDPNAIYLCDSGAQFRDGTTDTTRTLSFDQPTPEQARAYTLVLKGHIAIDRAIFPKSTTGFQIDSLARQYLWSDGLDYFHGTGHGVGSFLNVHEGPAGIGPRIAYNEAALKPGMVLSNEPGYYKDGEFGIRIENVVIVKEINTPNQFGDRPYYGFEHVTMVPMDRRLIDVSLLDGKERAWVNAYHDEVWSKISPRLEKGGLAWKWLERECKAF